MGKAHASEARQARLDDLAATLNELVADPGACAELAAASARAAAAHYSWDEIGRRTVDLYNRLLERS